MFSKDDPRSFSKYCTLIGGKDKNDLPIEVGTFAAEYQVTRYDDVQLNQFSPPAPASRKFLVQCSQRISIFNPNGINLSAKANLDPFHNYPAMINAMMFINKAAGVSFRLLNYSPVTVNTKVQSSNAINTGTGATSSNSITNTVGTSHSDSNSYETTAMGGSTSMRGSSDTQYSSGTKGSGDSTSRSRDVSGSASMSIKDWGAYAMTIPGTRCPYWTFAQEYPWDVIECRNTIGSPNANGQIRLDLPEVMSARLYDKRALYPPSQLSMFGVNFVMQALWLVSIDNNQPDEVSMEHSLFYYKASHNLVTVADKTEVGVFIDYSPTILNVDTKRKESLATTLNLPLLGLDPVSEARRSAIVGFIPGKFVVPPVPAGGGSSGNPIPFKIISGTNDLMVLDTSTYRTPVTSGIGFSVSQTSLTATLDGSTPRLAMTLYFKITDVTEQYALFMKHWKVGDAGVMLSIAVNGLVVAGDVNPVITKYVDATEAQGGEGNITTVALRNQNYASVDYHDYLKLGLNTIEIVIQPIEGSACVYQIRALSIEKI